MLCLTVLRVLLLILVSVFFGAQLSLSYMSAIPGSPQDKLELPGKDTLVESMSRIVTKLSGKWANSC